MKRTKKFIAMLIAFALVLSFIPADVARADGTYTLEFTAADGHTVAVEGGHLKIDNNIVELKNDQNQSVGEASYDSVNQKGIITVANGTSGKLNYNHSAFTLYAGEQPFDFNSTISAGMMFQARDCESGGGGGGDNSIIPLQFDNNATRSGNVVTFVLPVNGVDTSIKATVTIANNAAAWNGNVLEIDRAKLEDVTFTFDNFFTPDTMTVKLMGADNYQDVLSVSNSKTVTLADKNIPNGGIHMCLFTNSSNPGGQDNPGGGGQQQVGGPDKIKFKIVCVASDVNIKINGKNVKGESDEFGLDEYKFEGEVENAGTINPGETNVLQFLVRFGDYDLGKVEINGETYTPDMDEVSLEDEGWFVTVPADHTYDIVCWGDTESHPPRTIIWTNPDYVPKDEEDAEWIQEFSLDHGYAYVREVYDEDENLVDPKEYIGKEWQDYEANGGVRDDGFGWVSVRPGCKVIFKFVPEYGYQLTDIRINGSKLGLSNLMNEFEFIMPDTNIHFDAEFTKTEDIVKAKTKAVSDGSITLGNELDGGSAQLTVNDAEISSEKKDEFVKAAGNYVVTDYLDIDLYQVFYKGKNDANDVWSNEITELEKDATISLKLADDVSADDVVLVHNIHDGKDFEVIEIDSYNAVTNTVTFKADSFSNFAIATKPETVTTTGTVSSEGIYVYQDSPAIVAGLVHEKSNASDDLEFRWVACDESTGAWFEISPWTKNNEWLNWTPDEAGNYIIVCYTRVIGNRNASQIYKSVGVVYSKHVIKDICQIPYEDGYLIGFETKDNPNQSYQYEMLVMDLTLYAQGNPNCWILSTGRATVSEGNAAWITWKPQYGYYLTLFRVYDADGKLLDQQCYGFVNAY